jgi:hypothetical protein
MSETKHLFILSCLLVMCKLFFCELPVPVFCAGAQIHDLASALPLSYILSPVPIFY